MLQTTEVIEYVVDFRNWDLTDIATNSTDSSLKGKHFSDVIPYLVSRSLQLRESWTCLFK